MKSITVIDTQNGKEYEFSTRKQAAEWLKVSPAVITNHMNGKSEKDIHNRYKVEETNY